MNYKQQLNDILRLRIFFQTEQEMSQYIDYQLKGNHFNKLKPFQAEAYWTMFDRMCRRYSGNLYGLDDFIATYEATSKFWYRHISGKNIIADDGDLKDFVSAALFRQYAENIKPKVKTLAEDFCKQETKDISLLLLMTWGVIPSYTRKSQQDIADIKADFNKVYERLRTLNVLICKECNTEFNEANSLQELHYAKDNDGICELSPCRMTLITLTNKILVQLFLMKNRSYLVDCRRGKNIVKPDIEDIWIAEGAAQDDTWIIQKVEDSVFYMFYHCTINFKEKQIHYKRWQLSFIASATPNTYQTTIADRKFDYYNMLRNEMPTRYLHIDYTSLEFNPYEKCIEKICFHINSPLGNRPLTLTRLKENQRDYYWKLFHTYEQIDDEKEYDVQFTTIDSAISRDAIYMKIGDSTYKLEKFRDGEEAIEGICKQSIEDEIFLAKLKVDGNTRQYILMNSINFIISLEDFLKRCAKIQGI